MKSGPKFIALNKCLQCVCVCVSFLSTSQRTNFFCSEANLLETKIVHEQEIWHKPNEKKYNVFDNEITWIRNNKNELIIYVSSSGEHSSSIEQKKTTRCTCVFNRVTVDYYYYIIKIRKRNFNGDEGGALILFLLWAYITRKSDCCVCVCERVR